MPANTAVPAGTAQRAVVPPRAGAPLSTGIPVSGVVGRGCGRRAEDEPAAGERRRAALHLDLRRVGGLSSRTCSAWVSVAVTDRVPGEMVPTRVADGDELVHQHVQAAQRAGTGAPTVAVRTRGAGGVTVGLPSASVPVDGFALLLPADLEQCLPRGDRRPAATSPADRSGRRRLDRDGGVGDDRAGHGDRVAATVPSVTGTGGAPRSTNDGPGRPAGSRAGRRAAAEGEDDEGHRDDRPDEQTEDGTPRTDRAESSRTCALDSAGSAGTQHRAGAGALSPRHRRPAAAVVMPL